MSALSIQPTYPIFTDIDGQPLEAGYVWIGTANLDPQTNPINVYWDAALTILAPQPIRTLAGYPANSGTPARLYVNSDYSIRVMNKNGSTVYSAPAATERYSDVVISMNAANVVYDPAGTGAVATTVQAKLRETVSVKDFGAVGDGVTDDTAAIQAAIDALFPAMNNFAQTPKLHFPAGNYLISSGIIINSAGVNPAGASPIHMYGDGIYSTQITAKPGSAINAMFEFRGPAAGSSTWESTICDMFIGCYGHANYGIAGFGDARVPYLQLTNVFIREPLLDGIYIRDAYGMIFQHVTVRGAGRDGFALFNNSGSGQNNGALLNGCLGWVCTRFGFNVYDSYAVHFNTCIVEGNAGGGIFIGPSKSVFVDNCYFEANASTGITFTSPTTFSVKGDIIISRSPTQIDAAFPANVTVSNCFTSPSTGQECFVFGNNTSALIIENCRNNSTTTFPDLVRYFGTLATSASYGSPYNLSIRNNVNFSTLINIENLPNTILGVSPTTVLIDAAQKQNIAELELNRWVNVASGSGGVWRRSSTTFPFNPNVPVWEIDASGFSGGSHAYGFSINAANYPNYHGRWMQFFVFTKKNAVGNVSNIRALVAGAFDGAFYTTNTDWKVNGGIFKMPTSGTILFGVNKIGDSDIVQVACPVLCELGADVKALYGAIGNQIQFYGATAPVVGTWKRGDIVWNTTPSAAGVPGWVCVTAGTPGTWKTWGAISA